MNRFSDPDPMLHTIYQPGITDPQWRIDPPAEIADNKVEAERYMIERAGRVDPQNFLTVVTANVVAGNATELRDILKSLSIFARVQMTRNPDQNHIPILKNLPATWRVTITIGLGHKLFMTEEGEDRFGLRHLKPKWLRTMPKVAGDKFDPVEVATDLIVLIASDHPYVNVSIARALCQGNWGEQGVKEHRIVVRTMDQGFARPDRREFLRFDDGIDNLSNAKDEELNRMVYVGSEDNEPEWTKNGAYLVWRKIRENLPFWEAFSVAHQEGMIGRKKDTGKPLSKKATGPGDLTPVYSDHKDSTDGPLTAHIRKVQPRRSGLDLLDIADMERRFLRRGCPYFEGLTESGEVSCGLLFLAFMRDLRKQFEWPVENWQTNPDFPLPGTGIDIMYGSGVLSNVSGGYFFCPPAPQLKGEFIGSGLFDK